MMGATLAIFGAAAFPAGGTPYFGEVMMTAAGYCPSARSRSGGTMPADGRLLQINRFMTTFVLIGARFGGDGARNFALPTLAGLETGRRSRAIRWCVYYDYGSVFPSGMGAWQEDGRTNGDFLSTAARACPPGWHQVADPGLPAQGTLLWCKASQTGATIDPREIGRIIVAADVCPDGTLPTDGRHLDVKDGSGLYSLVGAEFGGDGNRTFGIPKLTDPGDGLKYCVVTEGVFPEMP